MVNAFQRLACLLLFWTTAVSSSTSDEIQVDEIADGIRITCKGGSITGPNALNESSPLTLPYNDMYTGLYSCQNEEIFVKFRTCDNCVEIDMESLMGFTVGDVVATLLIAVGVHLVTSHSKRALYTSDDKSFDRQRPIPHNNSGGRGSNDTYEKLRKTNQRDQYDVLHKR